MSIADRKTNPAATIKKLDKKIKIWISNWVSSPTPRALFLDEPMNAFTDYLKGQDISHTLGDQSENLATWQLGTLSIIKILHLMVIPTTKSLHVPLSITVKCWSLKNYWLIVIAEHLCYLLYQPYHFQWQQSLAGRMNVPHASTY